MNKVTTKTTYYPNSKLFLKLRTLNNNLHGLAVGYCDNGQVDFKNFYLL